jgi:hypothetical protein
MFGVGGADIAAICSELRLPSRDGGAEQDGTSWDCRYENIAGDMGTFGGGVGGTGEVKSLNAATPGHGSPPDGIAREGKELREALLPVEPVEFRFDLIDCRPLFLLRMLFFLRVSSSEEAS